MSMHTPESTYPYGAYQGYEPAPKDTNTKAIIALVLAVTSIFFGWFLLSIPAIILGSLAYKEIKQSNQEGRTLAIIALVIGSAVTFFTGITTLLFMLVLLLGY